ncbi:exodeoxyribonuclease V subunit beta [Variovorax sp. ZT4R33]|uniref:exodeoxyribonuclease V subunit beta n=1 Tax=Variovorax sp. ZT4R33 TaxID=3443743 RepID=UPI003F48C65D
MSQHLDPLTLPLWGSRLIEASAGTGKTWTIAALYLRLVLGHGGEAAGYLRPLVPSEILVMTFTRAATRELSDRIRARLLQAARCFRGEAVPDDGDAFLRDLIAAYDDGAPRRSAAWRLAMAAESMDDAAVHTIDAWCQRMLREHAFDSGCLFDEELTANERAMLDEAAQDYWRQQLYPLSGEVLDAALSVWPGVDALAKDARALIGQTLPADAGQGALGALIGETLAERHTQLASLKVGWAQRAQAMQGWIDAQMARKPCPFDGRRMAPKNYTGWLNALAAWADDPHADMPELKTGRTRFTPEGMQGALKAGAGIDLPEDFAAFERLMVALDALQPIGPALRLHAAAQIAQRLAELKRQSGSFGFADMLQRLDDALDPARNGEAALRLRARMLAQYPVALIDEFQDTSPVQSRIFDRLYRIAANEPSSGLLLIGDPKQSIYGFRGADIHSYLQARRATEGRHYMLGTNHRSTASVVAAVNHLLAHPERRGGEGAFMYRCGAGNDPLPFAPVEARGRKEAFVSAAGAEPGVTLALDATLLNAETSRRHFAARCAEGIVVLLNDPEAGFVEAGKPFMRLRPADIAVLVRTGKEAAAVQRELRRRRVASVYLSDKDSVFASPEAQDLLHWLRAVAEPLDVRLARAAFATRTVGLSIDELRVLARDDEAFDARSEQLRQLHGIWQQQGVLTMLRRTLHGLQLPARWIGSAADGERRLTNFLHLAELLQAASGQLDGEQALVRWLADQLRGDAAGGEEQIVRLESDADLVKVVTVHKSKGLEYPLVFLPFASGFRGVKKAGTSHLNLADDEGERTLHLHLSDAHIAEADKERQREDLRLLYVALTRARHAVWVGLAALKEGNANAPTLHRSAIGYVLGGTEEVLPEQLMTRIQDVVQPCTDIALVPAEDMAGLGTTPLLPRGEPAALREVPKYDADFDRRWSIGSFSALVRTLSAVSPISGVLASSVAAVRNDEPGDVAEGDTAASPSRAAAATVAAIDAPWHRFPRGAFAGNFLHDQLEWLATEGFDLAASPERQQQLLRRCERQGWAERAPDVLAWLLRVLQSPLPPVGAALDALTVTVPEMEFWLPAQSLAATQIDALCRQHLLGGRDRPALPERELHGMLMGFADIVFEHGGRYWVLDHKSNHLGDGDADYGRDALEGAMAAHRYDVQSAIYLLALHRLLRSRLGAGYDPAVQLGGAVFLFLRGIDGPDHGCYHVPPVLPLLDALDRLLGATAEAGT